MTRDVRDQLLAQHAPKIRYLAERLYERLPAGNTVGFEDLLQAGAEGLCAALDRYDPQRQCRFATYAEWRILGAMRDHLRDLDPLPRAVREKVRILERAIHGLEQALSRAPSDTELAQYLGLSLATLERWYLDCRGVRLLTLDGSGWERHAAHMHEILPGHVPTPEEMLERAQRRATLAAAIDRLPHQQRQVLALCYHGELTQREIGAVLGLTESRISQIHTAAILRLRAQLTREGTHAA